MIRERTCVLLPYDGTPESLAALGPARALAEATCDILHVLHVCKQPCTREELLAELDLPEGLPGTTFDIVTGDPVERILERARERDVGYIVMASKNLVADDERTIRSITAEVLDRSATDVMVVPPDVRHVESLKHIMVPLDGTPSAAEAMPAALRLARKTGAQISMLHVRTGHLDIAELEPGSFFMIRLRNGPEEVAYLTQEFVERFVRHHEDYHEDILVRLEVGVGDAAEEILAAVERLGVDLIVSSWHGVLEKGRASVLKKIVAGAHCPVLVVKVKARKPLSRLIIAA